MWLRRLCDFVAATAMALAITIVIVVAVSRNVLGFTPIWTEPVVGLFVFVSVCAALPAGLRDGIHVSMHFFDRIGPAGRRVLDLLAAALTLMLGIAITVAASLYAQDLYAIGLVDYAGIPQSLPAIVGVLFGAILSVLAALDLGRRARPMEQR